MACALLFFEDLHFHSNGLHQIFNIDCVKLGGLQSFCCVPTLLLLGQLWLH